MRTFEIVTASATVVMHADVVSQYEGMYVLESYDGDFAQFPVEGTTITEK